ncbi:2Fe-2S iron-sulfur cluster-binding protein [Trujillonella humicola]|uniref:2Fe-2S iron-sulfur cluster-binding protein n=1 Tax=Trujillonella humicola TaxID=3383699 RepID=UPI00390657C4
MARAASSLPIRVPDRDTEFACDAGDTVLRAALRSGFDLAYECNSGGCGSCKIMVTEGQVTDLGRPTPGLTDRDRRKGRVLACQTVPVTPCSITAPVVEHGRDVPRPRRMEGRLVARRLLTSDMVEVGVDLAEAADFRPGQYAMLAVDGRQDRAYSMANLPGTTRWDFHVKRVPGGTLSNRIADLAVGDPVRVDGPYGLAHFRSTGRDVVCIAGGSGLAPAVSVARALAAAPDAHARRLLFFYGGRTAADLCAEAFVDECRPALKEVEFHQALSAADDDVGWTGGRGFVHDLVAATSLPDLDDLDFYVAGPPPMTDAVVRLLVIGMQVPTSRVHYDRFF